MVASCEIDAEEELLLCYGTLDVSAASRVAGRPTPPEGHGGRPGPDTSSEERTLRMNDSIKRNLLRVAELHPDTPWDCHRCRSGQGWWCQGGLA